MTIRAPLLAAWLVVVVATRAAPQAAPAPARPRRPAAAGPLAPTWLGQFTVVPRLDPGPGADNAPAIQRAHDDLADRLDAADKAAAGVRRTGVIRIPAADRPYGMFGPVWLDRAGVGIEGEPGSALATAHSHPGPLLILAVPRSSVVKGKPIAITPEYRPDLYGVLDATAVPAPGRRWGFRTNFDGSITQQGGLLTHVGQTPGVGGLDCWRSVDKLTVDFAYWNFKAPGEVYYFGMGHGGVPIGSPWHLIQRGDGLFIFPFSTQAARYDVPLRSMLEFRVPGANLRTLHRLTVQVDLSTLSFAAWADGVQLPLKTQLDPGLKAGAHLVENEGEAFCVGSRPTPMPQTTTQDFDFALCGLSVSKGLKYKFKAEGTPQARADGRAITDSSRYFPASADDPDPVAAFPLDEPPSPSRLISVTRPSVATSAILGRAHIGDNGGIGPFRVKGLTLLGGDWNQVVAIGQALDVRIEDCRIRGGASGIGNLYYGANYPIVIRDCDIDSSQDSSISLSMAIATLDNINLQNSGRATLRFRGCNVDAAHLKVAFWNTHSQAMVKIFNGDYGGIYTFRDVLVDFEGQAYGQAFCVAERTAYLTQGSLRFQDLNLGTIGPVPLFLLKDTFEPTTWPGRLMVDNLQTSGPPASWVDTDSPNWGGAITNSRTGGPPPAAIRYSGKPGTSSPLKVPRTSPDE